MWVTPTFALPGGVTKSKRCPCRETFLLRHSLGRWKGAGSYCTVGLSAKRGEDKFAAPEMERKISSAAAMSFFSILIVS